MTVTHTAVEHFNVCVGNKVCGNGNGQGITIPISSIRVAVNSMVVGFAGGEFRGLVGLGGVVVMVSVGTCHSAMLDIHGTHVVLCSCL